MVDEKRTFTTVGRERYDTRSDVEKRHVRARVAIRRLTRHGKKKDNGEAERNWRGKVIGSEKRCDDG